MSMEVEFDDKDYWTMLNWYELLYGPNKRNPCNQEIKTLAKIQMFATQYALDIELDKEEGKR